MLKHFQHRQFGKRKTIVIVAEGAHDLELNKISPNKVKDLLANRLKLDTRITTLGHVQRGGTPCAYDRQLATLQGVEAVKAVLEATPETPSKFIAVIENKIVRNPLIEAVATTGQVAEAIKVKDFKRAMDLRGPEFAEYYTAYMTTTATNQLGMHLPKEKVSLGFVLALNRFSLHFAANENCHYSRRCSCWRHELGHKSSRSVLLVSRPQTDRHA